jgi:glycosyltransferase involved in cell wall biosynthesis
MTNAAIYMHPDAFDTGGERLLGRQSAGEGFLRGLIRHADVDQFHFWHAGVASPAALDAAIRRLEPTDKAFRWIGMAQRGHLARPGVVHLPAPHIDKEAWARRPYGAAAYSICGLTHTTATARITDNISNMLIAPSEGHDALICTSSAVRASVEAQLDGVRDYLAGEYGGPRLRAEPQRVTIPLGVIASDFTRSQDHRKTWRARLNIPENAVVALYVGRFHVQEKMNPALMALALERAVQKTGQAIYWVNSGWSPTPEEHAAYHGAARALCPSVHYIEVDGRPADVRFTIWSVADFFISFSDNIQETFGLTPVEAMAAGLPCVVTDWDGYRDTVRHGEDGFRIATTAPAPGEGFDLAYWYANGVVSYPEYVGAAAQFTALDFGQAAEAIAALIQNADLRLTLGANAQVRARSVFDWSAIIPQYQALWGEQNARRQVALPSAPIANNPFRPDPFSAFASYPTHHLANDWCASLSPGVAWPDAKLVLSGPLAAHSYSNAPNLEEAEQIVTWLADRAGASIGDLIQIFPAQRRSVIARGLLWIARYGVIELRPPR